MHETHGTKLKILPEARTPGQACVVPDTGRPAVPFFSLFQAMNTWQLLGQISFLSLSFLLENGGTDAHLRAAPKIERKCRSTYFHTWQCLMAVTVSSIVFISQSFPSNNSCLFSIENNSIMSQHILVALKPNCTWLCV